MASPPPLLLSLTLSLLFLLSLSTAIAATSSSSDILIQQVVGGADDGDGDSAISSVDDLLLNADHHFSLFKSRYEKTYVSQEEHDLRFGIFKANLRRAKRHQLLDPSAVHGITKFSDLTPREFRQRYLGFNGGKRKLRLPSDANKAPILPTNNLPEEFDWRDHGAVTKVKNQVLILIYFAIEFVLFFNFVRLIILSFCVAMFEELISE